MQYAIYDDASVKADGPVLRRHADGDIEALAVQDLLHRVPERAAAATAMLAVAAAALEKFSHVTKWNEPKKVGRRIYDDKVFYESLSKQRSEGKALSDRQFAALQKLAAKYQL